MEHASTVLDHARQSRSVLLTGPEGPDGDSIGACLALQLALRALVPGLRVDVAGAPGFRYAWLRGAAGMIPDEHVGVYDGVIVLDGDRKRLPRQVGVAFGAARWTGIIDHHRSTDAEGYTWAWLEASTESTCVMVRELLRAWDIPLDRTYAEMLYTGLIFDTGAFRYSNTKASSHTLAAELLATGIDHAEITLKVLAERRTAGFKLLARMLAEAQFWAEGKILVATYTRALADELGAHELDVEGVVDILQHTQGVEIGMVVVEKGPRRVKLSLRSRGAVDVAALARRLNERGGGHAKAAGTGVELGLAEALGFIEPIMTAAVQGLSST